ncbi:ATPase-like protein [Richelia sinica FACHB-800]|uniref:ATPase-like protein n=2 Tax=Richelia TaxID=98443 RepID=A0A975TCJ5_9NOST|nr:ATPase-like protein [Richelia sinica FACHB-800]
MVRLAETFGNTRRYCEAALLSDGTLRVLAIAAAMLSATEGSLVVIEEIDNGVHPNRAKHLLASIRDIAERRKLRVLLSTHNPALMDALSLFCQSGE